MLHKRQGEAWTGRKPGARDPGVTTLPFTGGCPCSQSRHSTVGIALGYGLDDQGSRVRFPAGTGNFSLRHRVQNGYGAHPASYPMGTGGSFPGCKAAEA
jgi:hypothetical protein